MIHQMNHPAIASIMAECMAELWMPNIRQYGEPIWRPYVRYVKHYMWNICVEHDAGANSANPVFCRVQCVDDRLIWRFLKVRLLTPLT